MAELTAAHRSFLAEKRFAVVGTKNPDGSPHLAVMWYLVDGDDIVVNSAQGRIKDRNLAADPRMSVLVEDGYRWIRIDGRAKIEHDQAIGEPLRFVVDAPLQACEPAGAVVRKRDACDDRAEERK